MTDTLTVDDEVYDADDIRDLDRGLSFMTIWKRELEVSVRRGIDQIEKLLPYVMWDAIDGEADAARAQATLDLMRQSLREAKA